MQAKQTEKKRTSNGATVTTAPESHATPAPTTDPRDAVRAALRRERDFAYMVLEGLGAVRHRDGDDRQHPAVEALATLGLDLQSLARTIDDGVIVTSTVQSLAARCEAIVAVLEAMRFDVDPSRVEEASHG